MKTTDANKHVFQNCEKKVQWNLFEADLLAKH